MDKKYIGIVALVIVCLVVGVYYALTHRASDVPVDSTTSVATSTSTAITDDDSLDPDFVGDSTYILEPDPKLHIYADMTLDPDIITINYELKDVTLCGNTYKTKQIFIDGVDVVQRLAQLLDADAQKNDWYCDKLKANTRDTGGILAAGDEIHIFIATDGMNYSFAPHIGNAWDGGYPIYVLPEKNEIVGHIGYFFGTLR